VLDVVHTKLKLSSMRAAANFVLWTWFFKPPPQRRSKSGLAIWHPPWPLGLWLLCIAWCCGTTRRRQDGSLSSWSEYYWSLFRSIFICFGRDLCLFGECMMLRIELIFHTGMPTRVFTSFQRAGYSRHSKG
jgi:hypothetical protein